jgi:hypothetical protein
MAKPFFFCKYFLKLFGYFSILGKIGSSGFLFSAIAFFIFSDASGIIG